MQVISCALPRLRDVRLSEAVPPQSVADLYLQIADLLWDLRRQQATPEQLRDDSLELKRGLIALVDRGAPPSAASAASEWTLTALAGGMFAGALDGTLLFALGESASQPELRCRDQGLHRPCQLLWDNLGRVLEVAADNWSQAHVDDLQLLSGYGRHQNRDSLQEGEAAQREAQGDWGQFGAFLLASFKGGYAMGVADAAVVFMGGERPGADPTSPEETA